MDNKIRPYKKDDFKTVRYIFSALNSNMELSSTLFCDYYLENEPDCCFVAVDEFDNPCGAIVATKSYITYSREYPKYLLSLKKASIKSFAEYTKISKKVEIVNEKYPAHLFISVLPAFQGKGRGKDLFLELISKLKTYNVKGINVILDADNKNAIGFFERLGFEKNKKVSSSKDIYIYDI